MKKVITILLIFILIFSITGCSSSEKKIENSDVQLELTLDELSKYNGENGENAYVAVDGVIYDVTGIKAWKNGKHNGNVAGTDVSSQIKDISPHGLKVLEKLMVVGKIVE